jgi:predicted transcriptional regulator
VSNTLDAVGGETNLLNAEIEKFHSLFNRICRSGLLHGCTRNDVIVLMNLLSHRNPVNGLSWPTLATIAGEIGIRTDNTSRVSTAIDNLLRLGFLEKVRAGRGRRKGAGNKKGRSSVFRVMCPDNRSICKPINELREERKTKRQNRSKSDPINDLKQVEMRLVNRSECDRRREEEENTKIQSTDGGTVASATLPAATPPEGVPAAPPLEDIAEHGTTSSLPAVQPKPQTHQSSEDAHDRGHGFGSLPVGPKPSPDDVNVDQRASARSKSMTGGPEDSRVQQVIDAGERLRLKHGGNEEDAGLWEYVATFGGDRADQIIRETWQQGRDIHHAVDLAKAEYKCRLASARADAA